MSSMLMGRMMQMPLLTSSLLLHAARHAGDSAVVSKRCEGDVHRSDWAEVERRSRQLAQALVVVGMHGGMRVGVHGRSFRDVGKG